MNTASRVVASTSKLHRDSSSSTASTAREEGKGEGSADSVKSDRDDMFIGTPTSQGDKMSSRMRALSARKSVESCASSSGGKTIPAHRRGHFPCWWSHWLTHSMWKMWPHGSRASVSPCAKSAMQITQVGSNLAESISSAPAVKVSALGRWGTCCVVFSGCRSKGVTVSDNASQRNSPTLADMITAHGSNNFSSNGVP